MADQPARDEVITFKGADIRELSREDLIEAVRDGFKELTILRSRLNDEGRMKAAREEDFDRHKRAQSHYFGNLAEYQKRILDSASAYNQLIVIGGYAAFFGVWAAFARELKPTVVLTSGVLILVSLLIYVTWTVICMYRTMTQNIATIQTFKDGVEGFENRVKATAAAQLADDEKLLKFWRPVVWIAGLSGFAAATLLGGAALMSVVSASTTQMADDQVAGAELRAIAAAKKAECSARAAELYSRAIAKPGPTATNPKTGQRALVIAGRWQIVPTC